MSRSNRGKGRKSGALGQSDNTDGQNPNGGTGTPKQSHKASNAPSVAIPLVGDSSALAESKASERSKSEEKPPFNWMTFWTGCLVPIGAATCFIMVWQTILTRDAVVATKDANDIARAAFESGQRAWIAPMSVDVGTEYVVGRDMKFNIRYQNIGREPAIDARWSAALLSEIGPPTSVPEDLGAGSKGYCEAAEKSKDRSTIYPSDSAHYNLIFSKKMIEPIGRVLDGNEIVYLIGCFRYQSYSITRESRFCFYWIPVEGKNWKDWEWRYCPKGNNGT